MKGSKKERGWLQLLVMVTISLATLIMLTAQAQARDESRKELTGFYMGGIAGYAYGEYTSDIASDIDHKPDGSFIGIQAGWSRPVGPVILGIEGDLSYTWIKGDDATTRMGYSSAVEHDINYLGTIRPRVGFMVGPALIYGTVGFAFANLDNKLVVTYNGMHVGSDEEDSWHTGWTAGLGVDFSITKNLTLGVEYLYVDMGKETVEMNIGGYPVSDNGDLNINLFRFGIKYFF